MIQAAQILLVMPQAGAANANVFAPLLSDAAARFGIDTNLRVAAWLSQVAHETRELQCLVESFNYRDPARLVKIFPNDFASLDDAKAVHARGQQAIANRVYANQNGNGDEDSGDGWNFRGRSCIMTTGKENYIGVMLGLGLDLMARPELLEVPKHAADAAGFFWKAHGINAAADRGDIVAVSKKVNGGKIGLAERVEYFKRCTQAFCA